MAKIIYSEPGKPKKKSTRKHLQSVKIYVGQNPPRTKEKFWRIVFGAFAFALASTLWIHVLQ